MGHERERGSDKNLRVAVMVTAMDSIPDGELFEVRKEKMTEKAVCVSLVMVNVMIENRTYTTSQSRGPARSKNRSRSGIVLRVGDNCRVPIQNLESATCGPFLPRTISLVRRGFDRY